MNVVAIEASPNEARVKYAEYLRAVKERHSAEYEAIKNGYRELSRGRRVLDLVETMKAAGVDERGRPRLAIVRADAKLCWFRRSWRDRDPTGGRFSMDRWSNARHARRNVVLPAGTFPGVTDRDLRAVVPVIPPGLMPSGSLARFHILWEAEWEEIPRDPMLLRHLGKGLYVVLAAWDLTELERAVLRGGL